MLKSKDLPLVSSDDWCWYSDFCQLRTFPRSREITSMFSAKANILNLMRCNILAQDLVFFGTVALVGFGVLAVVVGFS
jgi:hypothetical protein